MAIEYWDGEILLLGDLSARGSESAVRTRSTIPRMQTHKHKAVEVRRRLLGGQRT
jgi:hypothetical protein